MAQVAGCWGRQTLRAPLYVYTDPGHGTFAEKRNSIVTSTIQTAQLDVNDWLVLLDDDDHYAPWHVETIAAEIQQRPQAAIVAPPCYGTVTPSGILRRVAMTRGAPPWLTIHDPGTGPHAGIALRVGAYILSGGYRGPQLPEDLPMMNRARRLGGGVVYSSRASYIHRRDRGDHRHMGRLRPNRKLTAVPPADTYYSPQMQAWDSALASW